MYKGAADGMHSELVQKGGGGTMTYLAEKRSGRLDHKMDHLACFVGGEELN
eukprot:SAG31_NODE_5795_length_2325_cov_1.352201_2_plen_51_part_00